MIDASFFQFTRIMLYLVVIMALLLLATSGNWKQSAMSRVCIVAAVYFAGALSGLFIRVLQAPQSNIIAIQDYWLTPALLLLAVSALWATYIANKAK